MKHSIRFGGPGSSGENAKTGASTKHEHDHADSGQKKYGNLRNPHHSAVSGGGGEQDSHHTHDPKTKGAF